MDNNPFIKASGDQTQQTTQPATPAATTTPATTTPAATTTTPANDDVLSLDDLFPEAKPAATTPATTTPAAPVAATPAAGEPDDAAKVKAELEQKLQDSTKNVQDSVQLLERKVERNNELATFFQNQDNAPFSKYQTEIAKVATDPRFINMPIDRVLPMALGLKRTLQLGAQLGQAANTRAAGSSTGGTQNSTKATTTGKGPDYSTMSDAEFAAATDAVMRGQKTN